MYLKPSLFPEINNWELISRLWQIDNGNKYIPKNPAKPNYRNMISSIDQYYKKVYIIFKIYTSSLIKTTGIFFVKVTSYDNIIQI